MTRTAVVPGGRGTDRPGGVPVGPGRPGGAAAGAARDAPCGPVGTPVPTPHGDATVVLDRPAGVPDALVVLGHGAGGTVESPDLVAITEAAVATGLAVVRVTQPYRVAGRRSPPRPAVLDEAWLAVVAAVGVSGLPLVVGGRSSGARVACRTAGAAGAVAVVALAYPTRPPRTPDRDRLAELAAPSVPVLVVQGERDPYGVPPPAPGRTVHVLAGATHSIRGPAARSAGAAVAGWLDLVLAARAAGTAAAAGTGAGVAAGAVAGAGATAGTPAGATAGAGVQPPGPWTVARDLPGTLSTMAAPPGGAGLDPALAALRAAGADVLVSLLPAEQATALDLAGEPAAAARARLAYRSLPIPDFGVPDPAEVAGPLRELGADLDRGRHVVVHCWGGVGRSSLVAAALLVLRGSPPETAWARVAAARGVPVPETEAQRRWVSGLVQGLAP